MPQRLSPLNPLPYFLEHISLIYEELTKLQKQAIQQLEHPADAGFLSNMFLVPKKDRMQRPMINLKALNQFINTKHFKMEGIHTIKDLLRQGD